MVVAKLLMYGLTDEDEYLTDFHFDENQAQGVFVNEDGYLGVILSGQIYELEYSESLFTHIKSVLALKTLGFN
jgi:hypothetical protein